MVSDFSSQVDMPSRRSRIIENDQYCADLQPCTWPPELDGKAHAGRSNEPGAHHFVSDVISHKHLHFLTLGLVVTIWSACSGLAAILDGLDVVWGFS